MVSFSCCLITKNEVCISSASIVYSRNEERKPREKD